MNDPLTSRPDTGAPGGMTGFANPSASVTLSTQNGTAVTAMRSDAAPALSQSIAPTWTGQHIFEKLTTFFKAPTSGDNSVSLGYRLVDSGGTVNAATVAISKANSWDGGAANRNATFTIALCDAGAIGSAQFTVRHSGNILLGTTGNIATTAQYGFPFLSSMAGTPTGVPSESADYVPITHDRTKTSSTFTTEAGNPSPSPDHAKPPHQSQSKPQG